MSKVYSKTVHKNARQSDSSCTCLCYLRQRGTKRISYICVMFPEVTKASAANVAVVGSFARGFAVHFANVNEPLQWNFFANGRWPKSCFWKVLDFNSVNVDVLNGVNSGPCLKLKTRPRFHPASLSLLMTDHVGTSHGQGMKPLQKRIAQYS